MSERSKDVLLGILVANIFAFSIIGMTTLILRVETGMSGTLILSEFVLLPLIMGMINSYFWRKHKFTFSDKFWFSLFNFILSLLLSYVFMGEGYICLLIVSPLILLFLSLGVIIGKSMFKRDNKKLNISISGMLLIILLTNTISANPTHNKVTDTILINAKPEIVWGNIVSFPQIDTNPDYWLFKIGLPYPIQSTSEGNYEGAKRKCIFSDGVIFEEKIVHYEPNKQLTFDILKQPSNPEIIGHINLEKGEFILQDNGDGTTTLIGSSWYLLQVKPSNYFNIWADSIIRHVHLRVMVHIKNLSEK